MSFCPLINRALAMRRLHIDNKRLEQSVRDRTHDLEVANRQLESRQSGAGIVLLLVSHDLRAPLRAVQGFCQIFTEDFRLRCTPEGLKLLGHVTAGAQRMGQLIEDILALSQLGRQPLRRSKTRLNEIGAASPRRIFAQEIPGGTFRSGSAIWRVRLRRIARRAGARQSAVKRF